MPLSSLRTAAASAALALVSFTACSTAPTQSANARTPAFYWSAAAETFAAGNYAKTADHLQRLVESDSEYTARAIPWYLVVTSGMARGYTELADRYTTGARFNRANALAEELRGQTQGYSRVFAEIVDAELALARGAPADAVDSLRLGQRTADLWLLHFQLGIAYTEARHYLEAIAEFDICTKRRGEATAIFLDDVPSFRYLATLPYWRGRAQEGLGNPAQARQSYEQYLMIRSAADDALTRDARTRVSLLP